MAYANVGSEIGRKPSIIYGRRVIVEVLLAGNRIDE
jgi:hypothetical protein